MKKIFALAALAAAVTITSCNNDDDVQPQNQTVEEGVALKNVQVGINTIESRAGIFANAFSGAESIGLYLFNETGFGNNYNVGSSGTTVKPENIKYDRNETEGWWTGANPIILTSTKGNMYAYYPWASGNTDASKIAVMVNANQGTGISDGTADVAEQTDYMWAAHDELVDNTTTQVGFTMNHALAMVSFRFVRDTYPGEAVIQKIELANVTNGEYLKTGAATMNVNGGAITGGTKGSVYCEPNVSLADADPENHAELPHMLIYPTSTEVTSSDLVLNITMDGKAYQIGIPSKLKTSGDAYKFEAGKNYIYTLKMKGHGFGADDEDGRDDITVEIAGWVDQEVEEGELTKPIN